MKFQSIIYDLFNYPYFYFSINTICLGGTRQVGNFSEDYDEKDAKEIFRRCKELCPSLEVTYMIVEIFNFRSLFRFI